MRTNATVLSFTLLSLSAAAARAADDNGPVFSGFVDTTFNYNLNGPQTGDNGGVGGGLHAFDQQANTFNLNNAQLLLQGSPKGDKEVTYTLRVDYGSDAKILEPNTTANLVDVEEAYGTYVSGQDIGGGHAGIKVGKFVTYEGIEVIESIADPTITRGWLFWLAEPFTTTGAVLTYQTGKLDFALGVVNGWDLITDNNGGKTAVFKATYNGGDDILVTFSGLYGPEKSTPQTAPQSDDNNRLSLDLTGVTKKVQNLDLNFQLNYGKEEHSNQTPIANRHDAKWYGIGVQPVYHVNKKFSIGARLESFNDVGGSRTASVTGFDNLHLFTASVCPAYQVTDHFLARAELRYDKASQEVFSSKTGTSDKKHQLEIVAETIFSF